MEKSEIDINSLPGWDMFDVEEDLENSGNLKIPEYLFLDIS